MGTTSWLLLLTLGASLGSGLVGGVFFAFSSFVMKALARLPDQAGIAAMQSINVVVLNRSFLGLFLGTAAGCVPLAARAFLEWQAPGSTLLLAGSACYLGGALLVTRAFHIPLNDALARADASSPDGAGVWRVYVLRWSRWNHVRTAASLAAAAAFALALVELGAGAGKPP